MKYLKRTIWGLPIGVILLLVLTASVALAISTFTVTIPSSVNIKPSSVQTSWDIGVYSDSACTMELNGIDFGDTEQGSASATRIAYVKSLANVDVNVHIESDYPVAYGTVGAVNLIGLEPDEIRPMYISMYIPMTAPVVEAFMFNITFRSSQ